MKVAVGEQYWSLLLQHDVPPRQHVAQCEYASSASVLDNSEEIFFHVSFQPSPDLSVTGVLPAYAQQI